MGRPEWVGISHGRAVDTFLEKSKVTLPSRRVYENLCIGCDAFYREVSMCCKTQLVFDLCYATQLYDREKASGDDLAIVHNRQPANDLNSGGSG